MNKRLSYLLAVLALLAACKPYSNPQVSFTDAEKVSLKLSVAVPQAGKAVPGESDVNSVDVIVFNEDLNLIDNCARAASGEVTLSVRKNANLRIYALVNAREGIMESISTEADILSIESFLDETTELGFAMIGNKYGRYSTDSSIELDVERLASKIVLDNLVLSFFDNPDVVKPSSVVLDSIFVINVSRRETMSLNPVASIDDKDWINRQRQHFEDYDGTEVLLAKEVGKTVFSSEALPCNCSFYVYPNPADNGFDSYDYPAWCPRNTRLVLRFTIDGEVNYYPIRMPSMKSNYCYRISSLNIYKPKGSDHPDIDVDKTRIYFDIDLKPWTNIKDEADF